MDTPPLRPDSGPTDDELAALVRDVADGWTMPPQRLGERTWRDRVGGVRRGPRARRLAGAWLRRLGTAASVAAVATLALALVAVWLTLPRSPSTGVIGSPPPSTHPAPTSQQAPAVETPGSTPLPAFALYGPKLDGRVILGGMFSGRYRTVDLSNGSFGDDVVAGTSFPTRLFPRAGGGFVCFCATSAYAADQLSGTLTLDAKIIGRDGAVARQVRIAKLVADQDPVVTDQESNGVSATAELGPDGRTLYVGWAYRTTPVWHSGITVVDVERGKVLQTIKLPDRSSTDGLIVTSVWLNALSVAPDAGHLMLTMDVSSTRSHTTPHILASVANGRLAGATTIPDNTAINEHPCDPGGGFATATTYFTLCPSPAAYRLFALDGSLISETPLGPGSGIDEIFPGSSIVVDRANDRLFHWNSETRTLTRLELSTGRITGTATAAAQASRGPDGLAGLGRAIGGWLAPTVAAKTILQPGIVLSPDGSRAYGLGVTSPASSSEPGSTGVDVFDTAAMRAIAHWDPPADLISVATSADGQYVYVAGSPDVNAAGEQTGGPASLIVFEAATGKVRMIAGALGHDMASILP